MVEIAISKGEFKGNILDSAALDALEGATCKLQPFVWLSIRCEVSDLKICKL